jgi:multiple sugar transport system permease protein
MDLKKLGFWITTIVILLVFVLPLLWIYLTSFKLNPDVYDLNFSRLFFFPPTLEGYKHLFFNTTFFREILNTSITSFFSTVFVMCISLPAAYSFARFNTGHGHLLFITISARMFPAAVAAIPYFFVAKALGLLDSLFTLTMFFMWFNTSFAVFLLFGFFREIPEELEHAALVDGYGRAAILWKVIFPLIKPGASITAMFCLLFSWNEFLYALLFTRAKATTLTVGLSKFWGASEIYWNAMSACLGLAILPTLVAGWFIQRYIIRGLTFGAVKG